MNTKERIIENDNKKLCAFFYSVLGVLLCAESEKKKKKQTCDFLSLAQQREWVLAKLTNFFMITLNGGSLGSWIDEERS